MKTIYEDNSMAVIDTAEGRQLLSKVSGSGVARVQVIRNGQVIHDEVATNLILNTAIDSSGWVDFTNCTFYTYTDATANYDDMNGTYSQTGTTVTRVSGTGVFASGDVGKEIKFGTGERCHITAFTNTTTVTVSKTQSVSATSLRRYFNNWNSTASATQSKLGTWTVASDITTGIYSITGTVTFDSASAAYNLASMSIIAKARVVLSAPLSIQIGDQISTSYTYQLTLGSRSDVTLPISSVISGWPYNYGISTIAGTGSSVTITTSEAHNFAVGDLITITGAVPQRRAITSISSTSTTWTVSSFGHGLNAGDSIVHEGISVSAYNGTWTVAAVTDANTYAVTNASNPGAATGGTTRKAAPGTYFDGDYTVATVPNSTSVTVASTITGPAVDASATKVQGKDECTIRTWGAMFQSWSGSLSYVASLLEVNAITPPAIATTGGASAVAIHGSTGGGGTISAVNFSSAINDWLCIYGNQLANDWSAGGSAQSRVKQIYVGVTGQYHLITLRTPQEKKAPYKLGYPKVSRRFIPDLP